MRAVKRGLLVIGGLVGLLGYVWFAAVRNIPSVRRDKALRRRQ